MSGSASTSDGRADAYLTLVKRADEARRLRDQGDLARAEELYRDVLARQSAAGFDEAAVALVQTELGVVLRRRGALDEALSTLLAALAAREAAESGSDGANALSDANVTRDEIGKVYEALGDCPTALLVREEGKRVCAGGDACRAISYSAPLHACSRCKCVFYCGKDCQRADWKRHKPLCQPLIAGPP